MRNMGLSMVMVGIREIVGFVCDGTGVVRVNRAQCTPELEPHGNRLVLFTLSNLTLPYFALPHLARRAW